MDSKDKKFAQAAQQWDLETLYADLGSSKGKPLTPVEKRHLRGLLCGYSPAEIAEKLGKSAKGVEADLCNTLYRYVKILVGKYDEGTGNWRNIYEWLQEAGYKTQSVPPSQLTNSLPVDLLINKANISFEENQIFIDINIRLAARLPAEPEKDEVELSEPTQNLDNHHHIEG